MITKKIAIVLFNLGGPDSKQSVKPFLFNLFNDPAIIRLPNPFRLLLAKFISSRREKTAQAIYDHIGGKSPIVELTIEQAKALEKTLNQNNEAIEYKVFISMRYWHPLSKETAEKVKQYHPDEVILLPLYPQFSTTTTASSLSDWANHHLPFPTKTICCYPTDEDFITSHAELLMQGLANQQMPYRILFSAHGLPKKIAESGDPYQWQVEQTAKTIMAKFLPETPDWVVCYQSKVGRLEWLSPSTDQEIIRAGKEGVGVVVVPIAFVSEHSETLVELDREYKILADEYQVPSYIRIPALGIHEKFVASLAKLCNTAVAGTAVRCPPEGKRLCPSGLSHCPIKEI